MDAAVSDTARGNSQFLGGEGGGERPEKLLIWVP